MEQTIWADFLMKQAPVIIVLGLFCYKMYTYFIAQQDRKDATIASKDNKIEEHQQKVMELYGNAIEAQNKGNLVQEQLLEVLKETKEDVKHLSDKIK
jgi:hypothetical protein